MENDKLRPIAIIGMSFRFPGDATSPKGFWDILSQARSTRTRIPNSRFNPDGFYHPSHDRQGAVVTTEGCFMTEDPGVFDAHFFSITAAEAEGMDPQHRILLETSYHAFENAGIDINTVAGSQTACYIGGFSGDHLAVAGSEISQQSPYLATGSGRSMLSNRISWFYDLRGPSFTLDTACSSSIVALHEACRELQDGSSKMAVVGGANVMLSPDVWRLLAAQRFLSPDGASHSFDSRANGYGRGEGIGIILLKPLDDALRDNDIIRAVIRGSGVNQDGKTPAITVPNAEAQMSLIRSVHDKAGLSLDQTTYFEAHGTGTAVGDPLELLAIGKTIGAARTEGQGPVLIGSVKSNIGHLEGAAGIAGVIKTVLVLETGLIPSVAEFEEANPRFRLDEWNIKIPTELTPWPSPGLRRASVNSFGYGGTNAHVIMDDARNYLSERKLSGNHNTSLIAAISDTPASESTDSGISVSNIGAALDAVVPRSQLFVFSSPEQDGVARLAEAYAGHIGDESQEGEKSSLFKDNGLANLAYTLSERRTIFNFRGFAVSSSIKALQSSLESGIPKLPRATKNPTCAFVFTGQGAQWHAMGRELNSHAVFRLSVEAADAYISSLGASDWSVIAELGRDKASSRINEPRLSQPLCTVVQVALVDLLRHWGILPKAVVGHSSGEIGAAYAAGALSREDAWKIAYWRGVRSAEVSQLAPDHPGAMLAAALPAESAVAYLDNLRAGVAVVACVNSPKSVTISGDDAAVTEVEALLKRDDVWCRKLNVTTAYHSPHMEVIAQQYLSDVQDISPLKNDEQNVAIFSSVTGSEISAAEMGAEYWVRNLLSPVRFSDAVTSLLQPRDSRSRRKGTASVDALVEIGPHPALQGPLRDIMAAISDTYPSTITYTSMLQRGSDAVETALSTAGRLWSAGFAVLLSRVNSTALGPVLNTQPLPDLPMYPFNHRTRYWHSSRSAVWVATNGQPRSDLLGAPTRDYTSVRPTWKNYLTPAEVPWLLDHRVFGSLILPGSVYIAMVMEACQRTADGAAGTVRGFQFRDIAWHKPIVFATQDATVETILQLAPHQTGTKASFFAWTHFSIMTVDDTHEASTHCTGLVRIEYISKPNEVEKGMEAELEWDAHKRKYADFRARPTMELSVQNTYDRLHSYGLQFGPVFRNITKMNAGSGWGFCELETPDTAATMPEEYEYPLPLHPVMLDAAFQMLTCAGRNSETDAVMLPSSIESLYINASAPTEPGSTLKGYVTRDNASKTKAVGTVVLSDETWNEPVLVLEEFQVAAAGITPSGTKTSFARLDWKPDIRRSPISLNRAALRTGRSSTAGGAMAQRNDRAVSKLIRQEAAALETGNSGLDDDGESPMRSYGAWLYSQVSTGELAMKTPMSPVDEDVSPSMAAIAEVGAKMREILQQPSAGKVVLNDQFFYDYIDHTMGRGFTDDVIVDIFEQASYLNPNLEILEIGNGFASASSSGVIKHLAEKPSRLSKYTLTARTAEALDAVAKSLETHALLELKTLDISQALKGQDVQEGSYHYVILDDILLSTTDLALGLENIKKLLKPDGRLIIRAITHAPRHTTFVLGADPRWWRDSNGKGPTAAVRPDEAAWTELLKISGFSGVDQSFRDSEDAEAHQLSVMVSSVKRDLAYPTTDVLLVHSAKSSEKVSQLMSSFAGSLNGFGFSVDSVEWNAVGGALANKLVVSFLEVEEPLLMGMSEELFTAVKALAMESTAMLWVTRSGSISGTVFPGYEVATGLFRSIRSEDETRRLLTVDLSQELDLASPKAAELVTEVFKCMGETGDCVSADSEFAEKDGHLHVQRLVEDDGLNNAEARAGPKAQPVISPLDQGDRKLILRIGQTGSLDSLHYQDNDELMNGPLPPEWVEVKIMCTGLNFLDLAAALGEVSDNKLGTEAAGVVTAVGSAVRDFQVGDRVIAMTRGSFATHTSAIHTMVKRIPHNLSMEEAASIPIAFQTAWMSLVDKARIRKGESVLIHAGAGGVGQAAIQVCQHFGLEIFTTVGSIAKKELLMERYGIPEDHIFSSRDATFARGIRRMTNGRGVDVVLNSVFGELLRQSWHLMADFGRFVEIGKRDILANTGLDMEPFIRGVSFIAFNLMQYKPHAPVSVAAEKGLDDIFRMFSAGIFRPIYPLTVLNYDEVVKAMRQLQSGKSAGKFVLRMAPGQTAPVVPRVKHPLILDPNATYLLSGGLGGIGRSLALMLHAHGARNLAFVSKSGDAKEAAQVFLRHLRDLECNANAYACDISDREQLSKALEECSREMPPIKGLIQCAMNLRDGVFENMNYDDWRTCTAPKIQGSWNLHELLPHSLDFFVMLASMSGVIGNPGQANYAAGNTFQDALAHYRRRLGLAATTLDLGAVRDVGYLAESSEAARYWTMSHLNRLTISEADIHFLVKSAITGRSAGDEATPAQVISGLTGAGVEEHQLQSSRWMRDGKLAIAFKTAASGAREGVDTEADMEALLQAETVASAASIVEGIMVKRIAMALMMSEEDIGLEEPLQSYGVNSLVAVEIRTWLAKEFQAEITVGEISPSPIPTIALKLVRTSRLLKGKLKDDAKEAS